MRKVREEMGLENVKLMVPFCRTVDEGRRVIAEMAVNGLVQGEHGLEIYVMCEIPSNVVLAREFAEIFESADEALGPKMLPTIEKAAAKLRALPSTPGAEFHYTSYVALATK